MALHTYFYISEFLSAVLLAAVKLFTILLQSRNTFLI